MKTRHPGFEMGQLIFARQGKRRLVAIRDVKLSPIFLAVIVMLAVSLAVLAFLWHSVSQPDTNMVPQPEQANQGVSLQSTVEIRQNEYPGEPNFEVSVETQVSHRTPQIIRLNRLP